jgi:hypothetical protein
VTVIFSVAAPSSALCASAGAKGVAIAAIELARIVLVNFIIGLSVS